MRSGTLGHEMEQFFKERIGPQVKMGNSFCNCFPGLNMDSQQLEETGGASGEGSVLAQNVEHRKEKSRKSFFITEKGKAPVFFKIGMEVFSEWWWVDEVLGREPGGQRAVSRASADTDALNFIPVEQPSGSLHRWPNIEDWMLDGSDWMGDSSGLSQGFKVQSPPLIDLTSQDRSSEGKLQRTS